MNESVQEGQVVDVLASTKEKRKKSGQGEGGVGQRQRRVER